MSRKPLDKGRVSFVAEKYQAGPNSTKNRYANVGRATKWPADQNGVENIDIELDSLPIGANGPIKLFIFWDSNNNSDSIDQAPAPHQAQPGYSGPVGYYYSNGQAMEPQTAQRYQAAGVPPWPQGQQQPMLPVGY